MADGVGFEPTVVLPTSVFKTAALSQTRPPIRIGHHDRTRTYIPSVPETPAHPVELRGDGRRPSKRHRIISRARRPSIDSPARSHAGSSAGNAAGRPLAGAWWARTVPAEV